MLKRLTSVLLALALVALMAGCGGNKPEDIRGEVKSAEAQETPQTPENETSSEPERQVSLGTLEGGVYTNAYAGFGCTLDENWVFSSAEELQSLPDNVKELLEETDLGGDMAGLEQITDMLAQNTELLATMNVLYQKISASDQLMGKAMGEEALIDSILTQKDTMAQAYAAIGLQVTSMEKVNVTFLGENRCAILTKGVTEGLDTYIMQLFDYTRGSYSVTLTFTSYVEDNSQTMLDLFYPVD